MALAQFFLRRSLIPNLFPMFKALSFFKSPEAESFKTFFSGQSVSIKPDYYANTGTDPAQFPPHGWCVKSVSGGMVTLVLSSGKSGKLFIPGKYLESF